MHKEAKEELRVRFKFIVLEMAVQFGVRKTCREFKVSRSTFYEWKSRFDKEGKSGLYRKKPVSLTHPRKKPSKVIEKILELRTDYKIGALRIMYYLERYHGIKVSESTVRRVLGSHGLNRLPKTAPRRALHTKRYSKSVPGHHVQVDVKFLSLKNMQGHKVRRFQYTAVDDATRNTIKIMRSNSWTM